MFRVLLRERDDSMWEMNGQRFSTESAEVFARDAKRWLGDKSNLGGRTIEGADWLDIYRYFQDWAQKEQQ